MVKLSSLLFSGIAIFSTSFENINASILSYSVYSSFIVLFSLTLIYALWSFSTMSRLKGRILKLVILGENLSFALVFTLVILFSGAHESNYKLLFLLIIITSTIQSGMKFGLITASVSSTIVLVIDLIYGASGPVNTYFENDLLIAGVFILTAWPLGYYVESERNYIKKLEEMVNLDGLTELYNHRYFYDSLTHIINYHKRENKPVSMAFIDIDYFKHYNDLYGHQKGYLVLKEVANILRDSVRPSDIVARYGGEEFSIIFPDTHETSAVLLAEKIRKKVEEYYFFGEENQPGGTLTISLGVSSFPAKAKDNIELIKSADDALYRAKFFNKNQVMTYTSVLDELKKDIEENEIDLVTSVKTLISVINAKDRYTYGHVERVVMYSRLMADKLNLSAEDKKALIYSAYMHDIGKININPDILNKKMPLTKEEWEILKQHPAEGVNIIKEVASLSYLSPLILHHHEKYDGKGYPSGLKGEEIPFLSRVLTVIDSFDAMTSNRPYNKRKSFIEGIDELKKNCGTQFDPYITKEFIDAIKDYKDSFNNLI
ncbi:diguanylate cyclase [Clostridium sp.]|uniref:diguanylate cyclase n=1 Tax=Clostridium sp. TaxID=1506 RepID=UPI0034649F73